MLISISYGVHLLTALVFLLLIPLPIFVRGKGLKGAEQLKRVLSLYKIIGIIAHGALVLALISGLLLNYNFLSVWLITVVVIWVAIGAFLGITAKYIRLTLEAINNSDSYDEHVAKLKTFSTILSFGIIVMFILKYVNF